MERYPDSIRNAVYDLMRSGICVEELEEQFGLGHGTIYKWLYKLRAAGEDVAFVKKADRMREKVFKRFKEGATVQAVFEEYQLSRATVYRMRNESEEQDPDAAAQHSSSEASAVGKDEPAGIARRKQVEVSNEAQIKHLKIALAEKTMELDFFRGALREVEARRQQNTKPGATRSTRGCSK
jgi:transposase